MLRHTLLGIGITLIIISLVLIGVDLSLYQETVLKEDEIIKEAKGLGMSFPGENYSQGIHLKRKIDLNQILTSSKPAHDQIANEEELIKEAKKLGMTFPGENYNKGIDLRLKVNLGDKLATEKIKEDKASLKRRVTLEKALSSNKGVKEEVILRVPPGMSSRHVATLLIKKGVIKDRNSFILLLDKLNIETKIMAGTYRFEKGISPLKILLDLIAE